MTHDNFGDLFWKAAALSPDKIAIEQGDLTLTYGALEDRTQRAAGLLRRLGVGAGDKVFLMLPNDYRLPECFFGALRAGATVVPANIRLGAEALAYVAAHSEAGVMIAHGEVREKAEQVRADVATIRHTLMMDGRLPGAASYDDRLAESPAGFATAAADPNEPALLMYTSGSTGRPKGCLLSHASQWWQARSAARTMMLEEWDKALVMGPLYHANALWMCLLPMFYLGGSLTILSGFDPPAVLAAIDRYRPTYTSGTPSMFSLLLAQREALARYDVSSIRLMLCGSAPVPEELMAALHERFKCDVVEGYGLTEGGANIESPRWGVRKLGSAGLPVPDVEVRVVDLDDAARDCAPDEVGELWTRSPANALGYFKQPEVTAERFTADGWLRTGDLVRRDEQGYLYICGRKDDMMNCGGENIYPKEVESILLRHPAIDDVCVVSVPHKVKGEAPVAWVVLRAPGAATEQEIRQFFLQRGPAYAHPRRVFFIEHLPVSGTNKVDRMSLTREARRRLPDGLDAGAP
jgi:long-chain acyl-CoA synthetase